MNMQITKEKINLGKEFSTMEIRRGISRITKI
jgi:hypothetical protein